MLKKQSRAPSSEGQKPELNDDIGEEMRLRMYRMQVEIRQAEQRAFDLFLQNLVKGTSHLSLGQEAVATGFAAAMRPRDLSFCTYRGHAHTLARGVPVEKVLGELMQRDNGLMRGKGGSMHLTSVKHNMLGSYAIVGAHLTIANGAAWSAQYRGTEQVAVCFFGDGTTNIGAFHEALNLAVIWKLPIVFVCENNLYMEYTSIHDVTAVEHPAADRASAYGLEPVLIDGNDVDVVYRTAVARPFGWVARELDEGAESVNRRAVDGLGSIALRASRAVGHAHPAGARAQQALLLTGAVALLALWTWSAR